jgi:PKD domain/Bacterial Ig-like domain (group 2)
MNKSTLASKSILGFGILLLNCLLGLAILSCNTEPNVELHVNLPLPDSLADTSKVTHVVVHLLDSEGKVLKANVYEGPVPQDAEHKLRELNLGLDVPPTYVLQVQAFKNGTLVLTVRVTKTPSGTGPWTEDLSKPTSIRMEPRNLVFTVGDSGQSLAIKTVPLSADAKVTWQVGDLTIVSISTSGMVTPLAVGQTWIKAISTANPMAFDSIAVQVSPSGNTNNKVPTGVIANPKQLKMGIAGGTKSLSSTVLPLGAPDAVLWKSLNDTVAQVSNSGVVTPVALGEAKIVVQVASNASLTDTVLVSVVIPQTVTSLKFSRPIPVIYTGAAPVALGVTYLPATSVPILNWVTNDAAVLRITADGKVTGLQPGTVQIQVSAVGSQGVGDTATVIVKKDVPQIDAGKDQDIAVGGTATFLIRVTQEFGVIQELSWDLNGDGTSEGTSTKDSVLTTLAYPVAGTFTAVFTVTDGEGNKNTLTRRIRVGSLAPRIELTKPLKHDYVKAPTYVAEYLVDNVPKTQSFILVEGLNNLFVTASNADASDTVWFKVSLDTKVPVVKIHSPSNNYITNKTLIPVNWTVDSVNQTTGTTEVPAIGNGPWVIRRSFTDSAGNVGQDTVQIVVDTLPPSPPVFVGADTTTNNKRPIWTWNNGLGGNGTFTVQFGNNPEQELLTKFYQPSTDLSDAPYTLKPSPLKPQAQARLASTMPRPRPRQPTTHVRPGPGSVARAARASSAGAFPIPHLRFRVKAPPSPILRQPIWRTVPMS